MVTNRTGQLVLVGDCPERPIGSFANSLNQLLLGLGFAYTLGAPLIAQMLAYFGAIVVMFLVGFIVGALIGLGIGAAVGGLYNLFSLNDHFETTDQPQRRPGQEVFLASSGREVKDAMNG